MKNNHVVYISKRCKRHGLLISQNMGQILHRLQDLSIRMRPITWGYKIPTFVSKGVMNECLPNVKPCRIVHRAVHRA